jgi:hypothetical protein
MRFLSDFKSIEISGGSINCGAQVNLSNHLVPVFGKKRLDEISARDVEAYKAAKLKQGLSPKSVNNQLAVLGKCSGQQRNGSYWKESLKSPCSASPRRSLIFWISGRPSALSREPIPGGGR